MEVIIICATVLMSLAMVLYITQGLVVKYIHMKEDTYKDMEVLYSSKLKNIEDSCNHLMEIVESDHLELAALTLRLKDYEEVKSDFEDIQSKAASLQMGKAFVPRRRS